MGVHDETVEVFTMLRYGCSPWAGICTELRCDAGYKKLSLSADTVIDIPKSYGRCQIQVIGLPETKFRVRKKRA